MPIVHIRPMSTADGIARFRALAPDFETATFKPVFDILVNVDEADLTERKGQPCGRVMIHPAEGADIDLTKAVTTNGLVPVVDGKVRRRDIANYLNPQRAMNAMVTMKQFAEDPAE